MAVTQRLETEVVLHQRRFDVILDHSPAGEAAGSPRSKQVSGHQIATNLVKQELKEAGFTIESVRAPFATAGSDTVQWMIVGRRP
ncbi:MAG TPA: hypothetical protein VJN43_17415 [Bryobacteraceae bacterium]|nr:hypothetical protein [Bryobacteraceae bacterium]